MDVLELPRPVINFLRTMAKEGCRYVLSWDIFGGNDTVTLTLTWKLKDDESQLLITKTPQQQVNDDLQIRNNDSTSSAHRSRRDENTFIPTLFRLSRGKSLEGNNITLNKQIACHQQQVSSLERSSIINQQKKELDSIYTNLCNVKYATSPSSSCSLNDNLSLSIPQTHHQRVKHQCKTPIFRKAIPIVNNIPSKLKQMNHIATQNYDENDTLDPWVKRFECSLEDNTNETIEQSHDGIDETEITSGKVKFKRKPDYF